MFSFYLYIWVCWVSSVLLPLQIPNLAQIFLIGFYDEREFALYVSSISNELRVPVRYIFVLIFN